RAGPGRPGRGRTGSGAGGADQARARRHRPCEPAALRHTAPQRGQDPPGNQKGPTMTKTVLWEDLGEGVRKISLNRPHRLNAIVPELLDDLVKAVEAADRDPGTRAIVLTGEGRAFCSGDDLKEFESQVSDEA